MNNSEIVGLHRITKKHLKDLCKKHKLYQTPHLNDQLYLHFQGFQSIENLEEYTGLKCLWLESNAISEIQGLDCQTELKCLFLQNNLIKKIENLQCCPLLDTLNLSSNHITKIENCGIDTLPELSTLILSRNYLRNSDGLKELVNCKKLWSLDLSHNRIDDILVVKIFANMPELRVLILQGNPVVSKVPQYRKTLILECKNLTYLDSRPVFPKDRACAEAWKRGGYEEERKEHERWNRMDRKKTRDSVNATLRLCQKNGAGDVQLLESSNDEDEEIKQSTIMEIPDESSDDLESFLSTTSDDSSQENIEKENENDDDRDSYNNLTDTFRIVEKKDSTHDNIQESWDRDVSSSKQIDEVVSDILLHAELKLVAKYQQEICPGKKADEREEPYLESENTESTDKNGNRRNASSSLEIKDIVDFKSNQDQYVLQECFSNNNFSKQYEYRRSLGSSSCFLNNSSSLRESLDNSSNFMQTNVLKFVEARATEPSYLNNTKEEQLLHNERFGEDVSRFKQNVEKINENSLRNENKLNENVFNEKYEKEADLEISSHLSELNQNKFISSVGRNDELFKISINELTEQNVSKLEINSYNDLVAKENKHAQLLSKNSEINIRMAYAIEDDYQGNNSQSSSWWERTLASALKEVSKTDSILKDVEDIKTENEVVKSVEEGKVFQEDNEDISKFSFSKDQTDFLNFFDNILEKVIDNSVEKQRVTMEKAKEDVQKQIELDAKLNSGSQDSKGEDKSQKKISIRNINQESEDSSNLRGENSYSSQEDLSCDSSLRDIVKTFNEVAKKISPRNHKKSQLLKELIANPLTKSFSDETGEQINHQVQELKQQKSEQILNYVNYVYAQKESYDDNLELVNGRLMVVKSSTGALEELPTPPQSQRTGSIKYISCGVSTTSTSCNADDTHDDDSGSDDYETALSEDNDNDADDDDEDDIEEHASDIKIKSLYYSSSDVNCAHESVSLSSAGSSTEVEMEEDKNHPYSNDTDHSPRRAEGRLHNENYSEVLPKSNKWLEQEEAATRPVDRHQSTSTIHTSSTERGQQTKSELSVVLYDCIESFGEHATALDDIALIFDEA